MAFYEAKPNWIEIQKKISHVSRYFMCTHLIIFVVKLFHQIGICTKGL